MWSAANFAWHFVNCPVQCVLKFSILHPIFYFFYVFHKIHSRMGNSTDPDHEGREQSDLGLHCFAYTVFHKSWCKTLGQLLYYVSWSKVY